MRKLKVIEQPMHETHLEVDGDPALGIKRKNEVIKSVNGRFNKCTFEVNNMSCWSLDDWEFIR